MNPTGSSLGRALACPASEALPQVRDDGNVYADIGHGVHEFIDATDGGELPHLALSKIPKGAAWRTFCEQLNLDRLPKGGMNEVAFAYDVATDTARFLFKGAGRDYWRYAIKPTEYVLKIDKCGLRGGRAVVLDFKTGWRSHGAADQAAQLLLGALAMTRYYGVDEAEVQFLYLRPDGQIFHEPWPNPAIVDALELDSFALRLRALAPRIEAARQQLRANRSPDVMSGPHCTYCRAKPYCPAKVALARSMSGEVQDIRSQIGSLAPADAGRVYARALEIIDVAKLVVAQVEAMARVQEIPLPDGDKLIEKNVNMPSRVVAEKVEEVVRDLFGQEVAAAAITLEKHSTLKAITDALRPVSKRGQLAKNERAVVEELRRRGGLIERTSLEIRRKGSES